MKKSKQRDLKIERNKLQKDIQILARSKNHLDSELAKVETMYVNTCASTGAVVMQLDKLSKTASQFNQKAQAMNIVYMCCQALQCKHPNALSDVHANFWTDEQVVAIKNLMLGSFQILRKDE